MAHIYWYAVKVITAEGKTAKQPTERVRAIGITTEDRVGRRGAYTVVLYNKEAQSFILDNFGVEKTTMTHNKQVGVLMERTNLCGQHKKTLMVAIVKFQVTN